MRILAQYLNRCRFHLLPVSILMIGGILFCPNPPAHAGDNLYWLDMRGFHRMDLENRQQQLLVPKVDRYDVALDPVEGKLYWSEGEGDRIQQSNLDGTDVEDVITGISPGDIDIHVQQRQIYWRESSKGVFRANLDGTGIVGPLPLDVPGNVDNVRGFAVDGVNHRLYWSDGHIWSASLDGQDIQQVVRLNASSLGNVAVDPVGGKVYWVDNFHRVNDATAIGKIQCANLDGSELEDIIELGANNRKRIALDVPHGKIYWTDWESIWRANLDGSNVEHLLADRATGITIDSEAGKLYWLDSWNLDVQRANLDGSNVEELITVGIDDPRAPAIDPIDRKLYWYEDAHRKLVRSELDGSGIVELVDTASRKVVEMDIDPIRKKLYWRSIVEYDDLPPFEQVDLVTGEIRGFPSADRSCTEIAVIDPETSVTTWIQACGFTSANALAVDAVTGDVYWVDSQPAGSMESIQRTDTHGEHTELVLVVGNNVQELSIDALHRKLYWTELSPRTMHSSLWCANLDGSDARQLRDDMSESSRLTSDGKHLYWTVSDGGEPSTRVVRGNLDGTGAETLLLADGYNIRLMLDTLPPEVVSVEPVEMLPTSWGAIRRNQLLPNFPNPFNPETWIPYALTNDSKVSILIHNMSGELVRRLTLGEREAGTYTTKQEAVYWDGRNDLGEEVSSGVYFYTLRAESFTRTRRMLVLR